MNIPTGSYALPADGSPMPGSHLYNEQIRQAERERIADAIKALPFPITRAEAAHVALHSHEKEE